MGRVRVMAKVKVVEKVRLEPGKRLGSYDLAYV